MNGRMKTAFLGIAATLLLCISAFPAFTMEPEILAEVVQSAEAGLATSTDYRKADENRRWALREEAIRQQMVTTLSARLDEMQRLVDREIEQRVSVAFSKNHISCVTDYQYQEIQRRFKGEMYRYMSDVNRVGNTKIRGAYNGAEGSVSDVNEHMEATLKKKIGFENDIQIILETLAAGLQRETGVAVDKEWLAYVRKSIKDQFDN